MDLRNPADGTDREVDAATAAHAPLWTDAVPVASDATAASAPVWTDAVPTSSEATAAHDPVWTEATPVPSDGPDADELPGFELSMTAVLASAGAAVCAAILGSQLGVAGTLLGAALGAVVSMTAGAVFSHSLQSARFQLQRLAVSRAFFARPALDGVSRGSAAALTTVMIAPISASGRTGAVTSPAAGMPAPSERAWGQVDPQPAGPAPVIAPITVQPRRRRRTVWALAGGTLAGFALAVLAITGYEMISGTPVSGGDQGGLSVLGGGSTGSPDTDLVPTPTTPTEAGDPSSISSTSSSEPTTVTSTTTVTTTGDSSSSTAPSTSTSGSTSGSSTTSATSGSTTSTSTSSTQTGTTADQTATTTTTPPPAPAGPAG